jgi:hypothetical protein
VDKPIYEDDPYPGSYYAYIYGCTQVFLPCLAFVAILMILIYSFNWGDWIFDHPWIFPIICSPALAFVWMSWARKYQICEDRIKICQKWPFHYDIPFNGIDHAGEGEEPGFWFHIGFNFITAIGYNNIYIIRNQKITVNITPMNPKLFLENLNKAMNEWKRKNLG